SLLDVLREESGRYDSRRRCSSGERQAHRGRPCLREDAHDAGIAAVIKVDITREPWPTFPQTEMSYSKNGTPRTAYLRMPSSLMSTPIPGLLDTVMKPLSTHGPS